jgi:hypothetical protein
MTIISYKKVIWDEKPNEVEVKVKIAAKDKSYSIKPIWPGI